MQSQKFCRCDAILYAYALSAVSARRCYTDLEKHVSTVASESGQETWDDVTWCQVLCPSNTEPLYSVRAEYCISTVRLHRPPTVAVSEAVNRHIEMRGR